MSRVLSTDLSLLTRLIDLDGRDVVDVGCGQGGLARALAGAGARVVAVEVSDERLAPALAADRGTGVRYLTGSAQELPLDDATVDVALFIRTLHHVPVPDMPQALREARRVLAPGGTVYVAEPLSEGDYCVLGDMIDDELEVRRAAQEALARAADAGLDRVETVEYDVPVRLAGLDELRAQTVSVDPSRAGVFDARRSELAEAFERLGEPGERAGERRFRSATRVDLLRATSPA